MDKQWEYLMWNWSWSVSSTCNMQVFPSASQKTALSPHILVQISPHGPALPCSHPINQIPCLINRQGWISILPPPPPWVPLQRPPRGVSEGCPTGVTQFGAQNRSCIPKQGAKGMVTHESHGAFVRALSPPLPRGSCFITPFGKLSERPGVENRRHNSVFPGTMTGR